MKISFTRIREDAAQLKEQAARTEAAAGQLERIISLLQCQSSLTPVARSLKGCREPLADHIHGLRIMAKVLESVSARCIQSETAIEEQYEEGSRQLFAAGYTAYTVPGLYMDVIRGT